VYEKIRINIKILIINPKIFYVKKIVL